MRSFYGFFSLVLAAVFLSACAPAPEVVQGTVISYEASTGMLLVADETAPGIPLAFSARDAEMGAELQAGDRVRLAYYRQGETLLATRIMNITRQSELSQSGGAH